MIVPLTLSDFLERAELVYGAREAVVDEPNPPGGGMGRFTYAELAERARSLAAALDDLGVGENDRVAIVSPNAARFLITLFGVSVFGRVLVPVNFRLNPIEIYVGLAVVCFVIVRQLLTMMDNVRLMDQLRISREQLRHEATHDPLTSVANRSLFRERLERALADKDRARPLILLFIDVDGFKSVNDNHGHAEGDIVLRNVAARLENSVRSDDTVARLGGDEFGVLIDGGDADEIGARLLASLAHPHEVQGRIHRVHASIGVAQRFSYDPTVTADDVLGAADAAMYTAKRLGKGMVVVHGSPLPEMT